MYVCTAPEWSQGDAYATHRVCALPEQNANCAATVVGSCELCGTADAPPVLGDGDYGNCRDPHDNIWAEPVTVFLHSPCDLMPAGQLGLCSMPMP
jgi:hypothetical protein